MVACEKINKTSNQSMTTHHSIGEIPAINHSNRVCGEERHDTGTLVLPETNNRFIAQVRT